MMRGEDTGRERRRAEYPRRSSFIEASIVIGVQRLNSNPCVQANESLFGLCREAIDKTRSPSALLITLLHVNDEDAEDPRAITTMSSFRTIGKRN